MPGDGKTSRCGWEVLTSGRRERREDEGAGRRERGREAGEWRTSKSSSSSSQSLPERGRESGWDRRERGRVGVLSWLNLMSGGDYNIGRL